MLFHVPRSAKASRYEKRGRGILLRLARRRALAFAIGAALVAPAAWIEMSARYAEWWSDGLAIVLGATGAAFIWTGIFGLKPDWID
jgi:hypothetical protein